MLVAPLITGRPIMLTVRELLLIWAVHFDQLPISVAILFLGDFLLEAGSVGSTKTSILNDVKTHGVHYLPLPYHDFP